jgi:hypothetical protein
MPASAANPGRVFKTAWFAKVAAKTRIRDTELCTAARQVALGQADDLGGGVFKKRLDKNRQRAIVLLKYGQTLIYEYLYAKKDRANIDADELSEFRRLAKSYAKATDRQIEEMIADRHLVEICHERQTQIQE